MNVKPIPDILLGDDITLILPTQTGRTETPISNVRVECSESIDGYDTKDPKSAAEITVWVDYHRSTWAEFPIGARVKYDGMTFEIIERKIYRAGIQPHHLKFKAKKIGEGLL